MKERPKNLAVLCIVMRSSSIVRAAARAQADGAAPDALEKMVRLAAGMVAIMGF
jgi:hypothetical protein